VSTKPTLGVSSCLLGEKVRFDGGHKGYDWLTEELSKQVAWHAVCPEVEMGLGVPRESIRLVEEDGKTELVENKTERNLTALADRTSKRILKNFPVVDGYVFKKNSPSCGWERVRVHKPKDRFSKDGQGKFAEAFTKTFPLVPCSEEGRLCDVEEREHFVIRVFAHFRWRNLPKSIASVQLFHQRYKFLLMAHSPKLAKDLGKLAANSDRRAPKEVCAEYEAVFAEALAKKSTPGRRFNVLQHLFGYVKDKLPAPEKKSLWEDLEGYRSGEISFQAVVQLLRHASQRVGVNYLAENLFWDPYPKALGLRKFIS